MANNKNVVVRQSVMKNVKADIAQHTAHITFIRLSLVSTSQRKTAVMMNWAKKLGFMKPIEDPRKLPKCVDTRWLHPNASVSGQEKR